MNTLTANSTYKRKDAYYDSTRIHALQIMLCNRMDELLDKLDVSLVKSRKMYYGCCPIHNGDNCQALNLYPEGDSVPGFWKCNTKNCHLHFKKTILGFIRGVLSHQKYDWSDLKPKASIVSFEQAVDWACEFLGKKLEDIDVDHVELEKSKFVSEVRVLTQLPQQKKTQLTRQMIRSRLKIPATYFVERGWKPETLNKYDVGLCDDQSRPFYNRVVVPVYDNSYKFALGFTARSVFEKCPLCSLYHNPKLACPTTNTHWYSKWRNSDNFPRESQLYNFWFAKKFIQETGVAILVEGPGETWRCEEACFHNSVGMMGTSLTDSQQVLLETSGAMSIIVVTNNDDAGRRSDAILKDQLGRAFRLYFPKPEANDLGASSIQSVRDLINPITSKIAERGY